MECRIFLKQKQLRCYIFLKIENPVVKTGRIVYTFYKSTGGSFYIDKTDFIREQ